MSIKSTYKGVVRYAVGLIKDATGRGPSYEQQVDAWKAEADCGCGPDCCNREYKFTDKTTNEHIAVYFIGGVMKFRRADNTIHTVTSVAD